MKLRSSWIRLPGPCRLRGMYLDESGPIYIHPVITLPRQSFSPLCCSGLQMPMWVDLLAAVETGFGELLQLSEGDVPAGNKLGEIGFGDQKTEKRVRDVSARSIFLESIELEYDTIKELPEDRELGISGQETEESKYVRQHCGFESARPDDRCLLMIKLYS